MAQMVRPPVALLESMALTASGSESALLADRPHEDMLITMTALAATATAALKNDFIIETPYQI